MGTEQCAVVNFFEAAVLLRGMLFVSDFLQDNCLLEGGWLARHGTIDQMGLPHRSDVCGMGTEQCAVVDFLKP